MTVETELSAALAVLCPRVFPVSADFGTQAPYVVWQHVGGQSLRFLDNTAGDKRNSFIQITAWAATSKAAFGLARAIEEALCESAVMQVAPQGEPVDAYDDGNHLRGALQTFSIWATR